MGIFKKSGNKKIRLLIIGGIAQGGGAEQFVTTLVKHCDASRFEIQICLLREKQTVTGSGHIVTIFLDHRSALFLVRTLYRLRQNILTFKPHLILSAIAETNRLTGTLLHFMAKPPVWIARIGSNPARGGRSVIREKLMLLWSRFSYRKATVFVVNSIGSATCFCNRYPWAKSRVQVIYNPIDFQHIDTYATHDPVTMHTNAIPLILAVGRLHRAKRFDMLIDAVREVYTRFPIELWICGEGYLKDALHKRIRMYGLSQNIKLLGFVANPYPLMRQADLFVLSSEYEGMPNALVEALALKVPSIATRCDYGPEELIDHEVHGMLVDPNDAHALASAIIQMLFTSTRTCMAEKGAERIRSLFDCKQQMLKWETLFHQCTVLL